MAISTQYCELLNRFKKNGVSNDSAAFFPTQDTLYVCATNPKKVQKRTGSYLLDISELQENLFKKSKFKKGDNT